MHVCVVHVLFITGTGISRFHLLFYLSACCSATALPEAQGESLFCAVLFWLVLFCWFLAWLLEMNLMVVDNCLLTYCTMVIQMLTGRFLV